MVLNDERYAHWRMVLEENNEGVDRKKALFHAKKVGCIQFLEGGIGKGWLFG